MANTPAIAIRTNKETTEIVREARRWIRDFEQGSWGNAWKGAADPVTKAINALERLTDSRIIQLTEKETSVILFAAGSIGDDLNEYGLSEQEKRAWVRGMDKLRTALRATK